MPCRGNCARDSLRGAYTMVRALQTFIIVMLLAGPAPAQFYFSIADIPGYHRVLHERMFAPPYGLIISESQPLWAGPGWVAPLPVAPVCYPWAYPYRALPYTAYLPPF